MTSLADLLGQHLRVVGESHRHQDVSIRSHPHHHVRPRCRSNPTTWGPSQSPLTKGLLRRVDLSNPSVARDLRGGEAPLLHRISSHAPPTDCQPCQPRPRSQFLGGQDGPRNGWRPTAAPAQPESLGADREQTEQRKPGAKHSTQEQNRLRTTSTPTRPKEVDVMAASIFIEQESGTIRSWRHPHNGYYAGDFSMARNSARPIALNPSASLPR